MNITVIGEANIDITVRPDRKDAVVSQMTCVPSHIAIHHGGVARNIAQNLCLLGHEVKLMTVFGDDDFAKSLITDCNHLGIDLSLSAQYPYEKSPIFLSFNDETGNMQSAASDIALNDKMDVDWLKDKMETVNQSDLVVADTLLSADALSFLTSGESCPCALSATVPFRLEYGKICTRAKPVSSTNLRDSSNSSSVSPAKPTMTSVVIDGLSNTERILFTISEYSSTV